MTLLLLKHRLHTAEENRAVDDAAEKMIQNKSRSSKRMGRSHCKVKGHEG